MTPQELKASILQRAIQGKLVEQHSEEGTGEELFLQIQAEKQALIKSGKIKKEKTLPEITEDEMPFDIPESWKWCRITECGVFISGYTPKPSELSGNGILPYFKVSDMNTPGNELFLVNTSNYLNSSTSKYFLKNTIVYPKNGGAVFTNKKRILAQDSVVDLNTGGYYPIAPLDLMFVYIFFSNIDFRKCYKGTALPTIDMDKLKSKLFPLPPLAEQKRIVAKIEELQPLIDRYEQAWSALEDFNARFPVDMQKSILQMAIQGKLVSQLPDEGTGEELYQQLQEEKQALIKAGKLKKEKPLPEITEDEIPFDIPDSWRWCYVGELFDHNTGKAMNSSAKKTNKPGSIRKFITTSNLYWDSFDFSTVKEMFFTDDELSRCTATKNDILMCEGGAYYGRTAIWNYDYDICFQNHVHRLRAYAPIAERYFYYVFRFYRETGMMKSQGTAMPGLSSIVLHNMLIPLPPLAEQKRIVAKLEDILPLCEQLR